MKKNKNNYAFIDGQNLFVGTKYEGWDLDYGKFRLYLRNKYNVKKAFLFIGYVDSNSNLYSTLQQFGYILIFKEVLRIKKGKHVTYKGNVDAELVLHTVLEKPNYDQAVIVSGDGDFYCLIDHLTEVNKLKKIITPNSKYSSKLRKFAKDILPLGTLKDKLKQR
jgi:uncharacterized LabA/DUF88 family protein